MSNFWADPRVTAVVGFVVGFLANKATEYWARIRSYRAVRSLAGKWTVHEMTDGRTVDRQKQLGGAGLTVITARPWWKAWWSGSHVLDVNGEDTSDGRHHSGPLVIDPVCSRLATRIVLYSPPSDEISEQRIVISHDLKTLYVFPVATVATLGPVYSKHALCKLEKNNEMTFRLDCPSCFELSGDACHHRRRYRDAEDYINKKGVEIGLMVVDGCRHEPEPTGWWKGGEMIPTPGIGSSPDAYEIRMYPTSCKHWGWDMLTSILIHEFGHALLHISKVKCSDIAEEERQANKYGLDNMPPELIPEQYRAYREFCALSYLSAQSAYTEERLCDDLNKHRSDC